ncbi:C-5 cytosine-specific DNA methyltransferase [Mycoplasma feriruminatoris]|nr:C-5 cytosine-specific DNA methyltransferase [Mycoplasma feriruminatoris]
MNWKKHNNKEDHFTVVPDMFDLDEYDCPREYLTWDHLIIWALFDDGNSSYQKAISSLDRQDFIIYSIGINDPKNIDFKQTKNNIYKQMNLSLTNPNLIKELKTLPRPDIILASPPCESFSIADCSCRMSQSYGASNWVVRNRDWYKTRALTVTAPNKIRNFIHKETNRLNGESCAGAVVHIIETFKPIFWIIENPESSKIWDFLAHHWNFKGIRNVSYYYNYDLNFSKKPTCFLSNVELKLKKQILKENYSKTHFALGNYKQRSSIPQELIVDILKQLEMNLRFNWANLLGEIDD